MNFIRFENHVINIDNIAYVTRSDDNRVVVTFCAAKSESSLHFALRDAGAKQVGLLRQKFHRNVRESWLRPTLESTDYRMRQELSRGSGRRKWQQLQAH